MGDAVKMLVFEQFGPVASAPAVDATSVGQGGKYQRIVRALTRMFGANEVSREAAFNGVVSS